MILDSLTLIEPKKWPDASGMADWRKICQ